MNENDQKEFKTTQKEKGKKRKRKTGSGIENHLLGNVMKGLS